MATKKPSSVVFMNRSWRNSGCQTWGSRLSAHIPKNEVETESRMVSSYAIGMFAGIDHVGLPEMFQPHWYALQYHCRSRPPSAPQKPPPKMISGRIVRLMPIAG